MELNFYLTVQKFEEKLIRAALRQSKGCITKAAKILKMNRTTLSEKMRRYGMKEDPSLYQNVAC